MRIILTLLAVATASACLTKEEGYRPCDLDPNSPDEAVAACGGDEASDATCVVSDQIQCDSTVCGRTNGSDPFCTAPCEADKDCDRDGDVCIQWSDIGKYCTPSDL